MAEERLEELAAELERLSEQLADAAMDLLRAGIAEGTEAASALATQKERLVNRARSSVARAVNLLGEASAAGDGSDTGAGGAAARGVRRSRHAEPAPWDTA